MATPRNLLPARSMWVHVVSRCVRGAYLCGGRDGRWDYRRQWVEDRLRELTTVFAVEISAYAVMPDHVHAVVRMSPEATARWSAQEVVSRWLTVFGKNAERLVVDGARGAMTKTFSSDDAWVAERRERLSDLSWFMRAITEPLARRANLEDASSGRFWEGRYTSTPLFDQAALVACMAYVDLYPVRERIATISEESLFTSVYQRVKARHGHRAHQSPQRASGTATSGTATSGAAVQKSVVGGASSEAGLFVAPLARCRHLVEGAAGSSWKLTVDEYLTLVELTGRMMQQGKRSAVDPQLPALLSRLDVSAVNWIATMLKKQQFQGGGVGHAESRTIAAAERGLRWIRNRSSLFARRLSDTSP